eukprot:8191298-Heterocapsa_arctica.AAC.1
MARRAAALQDICDEALRQKDATWTGKDRQEHLTDARTAGQPELRQPHWRIPGDQPCQAEDRHGGGQLQQLDTMVHAEDFLHGQPRLERKS